LHGSAPWFLAYHALSCVDYDLSGEFEPWEPPQPFDENTWSFPNRMFTRAELLGYLDGSGVLLGRFVLRLVTRSRCHNRRGEIVRVTRALLT